MASSLPQNSECCQPTCDEIQVENIPGPQGETGAAGTNGTDGIDAFTLLASGFNMPIPSGIVVVSVDDTSWMGLGQPVFMEFAGFFSVSGINSPTSVNLQNLYDGASAYIDNAAAGTPIPLGAKISPGGWQGPDGSLTGTAGGDLEGTYPDPTIAVTTTKGDLIVNSGGGSAPRNTRIAAGADGTRLMADSAQALGMRYAKVDISDTTQVTGTLPLNQGGTGATTASGARTALGLGTMAVQAASAVAITGGTIAGITDLAVADGGTGASTAAAARVNLGVLAGYGILGSATAVDLNVANSDNAITMLSARYIIDKVTVDNASVNLTAATSGVFTSVGGGGTTIAADQVLSALTASTKFKDLTLQAVAGTDVFTAGTIYYRVGTQQGSAATANVRVWGYKLD